jgi:hypothetical protein
MTRGSLAGLLTALAELGIERDVSEVAARTLTGEEIDQALRSSDHEGQCEA